MTARIKEARERSDFLTKLKSERPTLPSRSYETALQAARLELDTAIKFNRSRIKLV